MSPKAQTLRLGSQVSDIDKRRVTASDQLLNLTITLRPTRRGLHCVWFGACFLCELEDAQRAERLKESLAPSFLKLAGLPEFKRIPQEWRRYSKEYGRAKEEFNEEVRLLARKLEDETEGLKGREA